MRPPRPRPARPMRCLGITTLAVAIIVGHNPVLAAPTAEEEARQLPQCPRGFIDEIAAEFFLLRAQVMTDPHNQDLARRARVRARRLGEMLDHRPPGDYDDTFRSLKVEIRLFAEAEERRAAALALERAEQDKAQTALRRSEEVAAREAARKREQAAAAYRARIRAKGWSAQIEEAIINRGVLVGMTPEQAELAWGKPEKINTTTNARGTFEQWVYPGWNFLYFDNGRLTSIQQSR